VGAAYELAKRLLFRLEPERAHALAIGAAAWASQHPGALRALSWAFAAPDATLRVDAFGLIFPNPLGLAAGFDKDGVAAAAWPAFGFGAAELGSVTALAQPGNPPPRLLRLPEERALINRMGFNNEGAAALAARLHEARQRPWWPSSPVGVNVGKSRAVALDDAVADYEAALRAVWPIADFVVLNVSSPNTPGLRLLQSADRLAELTALAAGLRRELGPRPVLLKVAPDLEEAQFDEIVDLATRFELAGLVATNTTVDRSTLRRDPGEAGGLSGAPLAARSLAVLRALRARTPLPLVSSGGIDSPRDAIARLEAGATLLQVYTGWVYGGPGFPRRVLRAIARWLHESGASDLRGWLAARDARWIRGGA
jgi:dihydroorotate dehydrogenase